MNELKKQNTRCKYLKKINNKCLSYKTNYKYIHIYVNNQHKFRINKKKNKKISKSDHNYLITGKIKNTWKLSHTGKFLIIKNMTKFSKSEHNYIQVKKNTWKNCTNYLRSWIKDYSVGETD